MPYLFMLDPKYELKCKTETVSGEDEKTGSDLPAIVIARRGHS
jgi:hypothetical protein